MPIHHRAMHRVGSALLVAILAIIAIACQPIAPPSTTDSSSANIVRSVTSAPITPRGDVAGAPTDIVIHLDTSMDPAVPGRTLLAENQIKVTLPDAFVNTGLPGNTIFTPDCSPPELKCSTGILLQGWPQHPIFPMFPPGSGPPEFYTVELEGSHTLVFTALKDVTAGLMLPGPGIKQIHLLAVGFVNPEAGTYDIDVLAETGPDGSAETGTATVEIVAETRPMISVTSVFTDGNPNTIYQKAGLGDHTPLAYDFLLWDANGEPLDGVTIEAQDPDHALLRRGEEIIGNVVIETPAGATGHEISAESPSMEMAAPVSGVPTARLTARFKTGSVAGRYVVTFSLADGNAISMFVDAE